MGRPGRLGLVEFRGFEMPPDARMSLAQQLLIRALIARFWQAPLAGRLVRWGTSLHDRFMLPHLRLAGFPRRARRSGRTTAFRFDPAWFSAQPSSASPSAARSTRSKASTWNCARRSSPGTSWARTGAIGGTVRYTDSSVERLQVKRPRPTRPLRRGLQWPPRAADRYRQRRASAGVRFKAWQPASGLHPVMPVNAPLTFDIVDTWAGALGGCVYHVAHPGGRNYETFPVNANEAEARRLARFEPHGHTPGAYALPSGSAASRVPADAGPPAPPAGL
jgi:uncharacterized protein (DUF2126 family)